MTQNTDLYTRKRQECGKRQESKTSFEDKVRKQYPLFAFSHDAQAAFCVVTRGKDLAAALGYAANSKFFPIGVTIFPLGYVPINAAQEYDKNHATGWLYRVPKYQQIADQRELVRKISLYGAHSVQQELINSIVTTLKNRATQS